MNTEVRAAEDAVNTLAAPGYIVWHDLMTDSVADASRFYADLLGWQYRIEHATDSVWQPGAADYPLIMVDVQAHGGVVHAPKLAPNWVAYIETENVEAIVALAVSFNASVERSPFRTPGVGYSAVLRDPQGALFCVHQSTHGFPIPEGVFLWDVLMTPDMAATCSFYRELFDWPVGESHCHSPLTLIPYPATARWLPVLATDDLSKTLAKAQTLEATLLPTTTATASRETAAVLADPFGTLFGLCQPS